MLGVSGGGTGGNPLVLDKVEEEPAEEEDGTPTAESLAPAILFVVCFFEAKQWLQLCQVTCAQTEREMYVDNIRQVPCFHKSTVAKHSGCTITAI